MKTFQQWVKDEGKILPSLEGQDGENTEGSSENTKRAGTSQNYPDAYVRAQYPHKYFNPISATADGQLGGKNA
jgi:hypothetical protein